jgi:hypothetical protein
MTQAPQGSVLLVGGIGLWPGLFETLSRQISAVLPGVRINSLQRVGYDGRPPAASMDELIADVGRAVMKAAPPVTLFGELGGATISLALALDPPPGLDGVVAHEPLLGDHEPELQSVANEAAARLREDHTEHAVDAFVEGLIGSEAWSALPETARRFAQSHASTIRAEVPWFAGWTPEDLRPRVPFMTTVGRSSPPMRHRVARVLRRAGARTDMTSGGHLASVDDPDAIVAALRWAHAA